MMAADCVNKVPSSICKAGSWLNASLPSGRGEGAGQGEGWVLVRERARGEVQLVKCQLAFRLHLFVVTKRGGVGWGGTGRDGTGRDGTGRD